MNKSLFKCNLIWFFLVLIIGFMGLATMKPDVTKKWLTENTSKFVDLFNLRSEPEEEKKTYIKREHTYTEPSAFEQNE